MGGAREKRSAEALYSELCQMLKEEQAGMRARFNDLQHRVVQARSKKYSHLDIERARPPSLPPGAG